MYGGLAGRESSVIKGTPKCACCGGQNERRFVASGRETVWAYVCDSVKCNEDQQQIAKRAARHGITYDRYSEIHLNQGGRCPVCGEHLGKFDKDVVIDHDHSCCPKKTSCGSCVRGILHRRCNSVIGYLGDDPDKFERIAEYLRGY
ncbi:endonuclease domain-containing protein [Streptomyces sp. NPDC055103]